MFSFLNTLRQYVLKLVYSLVFDVYYSALTIVEQFEKDALNQISPP
jgi:hypothetical protein